jgi:nucleotide-binding universal stress UspA family protein
MDKPSRRFLANRPVRRTAVLLSIDIDMSADVIVSYDGTANDDDALALGRLLAPDPTRLALAYIRHASEFDPEREALAQHDAERRLEHGAALLGYPDLARHVLSVASTGAGLEELADAEGASTIVFGSDYRTPPGHAEPPTSAQRLLEIGATGIGVAAAGLRADPGATIGSLVVLPAGGDDAAQQTAEALAAKLGARIVADDATAADLIVVGSQPGAPAGRIALSGSARTMLDASRGSVLIVPSGKPLVF